MIESERDTLNARRLSELHPQFAKKIKAVLIDLESHGWQPYIASGWRSIAEQKKIVERGDSTVYFSFHNATTSEGKPCALACDIVDSRYGWDNAPKKYWEHLGSTAHAHGLVWGGNWRRFPDVAHVELLPVSMLSKVKRGWLPPF